MTLCIPVEITFPASITLAQYEAINEARSAQWEGDDSAKAESRLFTALVEAIGYDRADEIARLGPYADNLLTQCQIGQCDVIDEYAA